MKVYVPVVQYTNSDDLGNVGVYPTRDEAEKAMAAAVQASSGGLEPSGIDEFDMPLTVFVAEEAHSAMEPGVFSSLTAAAEFLARAGTSDDEPQAFLVNEKLEWTLGPKYTAMIMVECGAVTDRTTPDDIRWPRMRHPTEPIVSDNFDRDDPERLIWVTSPISFEHAARVAVEKRQEWLRTRPPCPAAPPSTATAPTPGP